MRIKEGAVPGHDDDPYCHWQHPWLRLEMLIRCIRGTTLNADTWLQAEATRGWALRERGRLARAGWFN